MGRVFSMDVDGPVNGTLTGQIAGVLEGDDLVKHDLKGEVTEMLLVGHFKGKIKGIYEPVEDTGYEFWK